MSYPPNMTNGIQKKGRCGGYFSTSSDTEQNAANTNWVSHLVFFLYSTHHLRRHGAPVQLSNYVHLPTVTDQSIVKKMTSGEEWRLSTQFIYFQNTAIFVLFIMMMVQVSVRVANVHISKFGQVLKSVKELYDFF